MEGNRFGSTKRGKMQTAPAQPRWPMSVPEGHVKFRILCSVNQVGVLIGKRGIVIKEIREPTESKIQVEEARLGSPDQVITVIGPVDSTSRVKLTVKGSNWKKEEQEVEEVQVSKAQAALIRVFEFINGGFWTGTFSCRLLIEASLAGAVKGEGGEIVERISRETGCNVEIVTANLPISADPGDAMVEMKGNVLAVKKALVSVSSRLQACHQQIAKTKFGDRDLSSRPVERNCEDYRLRKDDMLSRPTSFGSSNKKTEAVPHDVVPREALYRSSDPRRDSFHRWNGKNPMMPNSKGKGPEQNVFTAFQNINLQNNNNNFSLGESSDLNSNLSVNIGNISLGDSRLSAASSRAPPSRFTHPVCPISVPIKWVKVPRSHNAVHCSTPVDAGYSSPSFGGGSTIDVDEDQSRNAVHGSESGDEDSYIRPEDPFPIPTPGYSPNFGWPSTMNAHDILPPRGAYDGSGRLSSRMAELGLGSGQKSSVVTNMTVEVRIPETAVKYLWREEGGPDCLRFMRQSSGASVIVREPHLGIITVSGTPDQIQTAQLVLDEFIRVYS